MSEPVRRGLGRSLDALLGNLGGAQHASTGSEPELKEIPVALLRAGRHQPRRTFDEQALADLASSISVQGVIQPILVRLVGPESYEIVAGERRWRAAQAAGLKTIPAIVRPMDDRSAMAVAIVENIQRKDLNPLEEAVALQRLIDECLLTHEQVAESVGKSRAAVTNLLRLIDLNEDVQGSVRRGELSFGHAKVLLGVSGERQSVIAKRVVQQGLSVRQTEALLKSPRSASTDAKNDPGEPETVKIQTLLSARLGLPVQFKTGASGGSTVLIRCKTSDELDQLIRKLSPGS